MASNGYIKLHRQIQDSADWHSEPFTRVQAWIDILLNAAHKPHSVRIRGIRIDLERGQLALSEVEYGKRWSWSRGKVRRFLAELSSKAVQRIVQQKNNVSTIVTVLNYELYQGNGTADSTASGTADGQQTDSRRTADGHIQEGKEETRREEGKEDIPLTPKGGKRKKFVKPTIEELQAYISEKGYAVDAVVWLDYYIANGWRVGRNPMKDWKATVRYWANNSSSGNGATKTTKPKRRIDDRTNK